MKGKKGIMGRTYVPPGVLAEHVRRSTHQPANCKRATAGHTGTSTATVRCGAVEAPCARCWRTCAHGDLQHWSPMQEQQGVYVCFASLCKTGCLVVLTHEQSTPGRIWLTPHPPSALLHVPFGARCSSCHATQHAPPTL